MKKGKKNGLYPIKIHMETEWSNIKCPCGKKHRGKDGVDFNQFVKEHKDHSNGFVVTYLEGKLTITPFSVSPII